MTFYGPKTVEEQASEAAVADSIARSAAARSYELSTLSQAVEGELAATIGSVRAQKTQEMQSEMEAASKEIYGWGYQVYDGMTGNAATAASDKLRDLSAISGFDEGPLSIKLK